MNRFLAIRIVMMIDDDEGDDYGFDDGDFGF